MPRNDVPISIHRPAAPRSAAFVRAYVILQSDGSYQISDSGPGDAVWVDHGTGIFELDDDPAEAHVPLFRTGNHVTPAPES